MIRDEVVSVDVVVVDRRDELLPGFLAEVRDDLRRQLDELGVEIRLGTGLTAPPMTEPGRAERCVVTTTGGEQLVGDIWFQAFGVRMNTGYLADGRLVPLTEPATVPVTERLNVVGHEHVYALGDITDLPEPRMAGHAQQQAEVVVWNLRAQLLGEQPTAVHATGVRPTDAATARPARWRRSTPGR